MGKLKYCKGEGSIYIRGLFRGIFKGLFRVYLRVYLGYLSYRGVERAGDWCRLQKIKRPDESSPVLPGTVRIVGVRSVIQQQPAHAENGKQFAEESELPELRCKAGSYFPGQFPAARTAFL